MKANRPLTVAIAALNFAAGQANSHESHLPQLVHHLVALPDDARYVLFLRKDNASVFPEPSERVRRVVFPSLCRFKMCQVLSEQVVVPLLLLLFHADLFHFTSNIRPWFLPCRSIGTIHWVLTPVIMRAFSYPKLVYSRLFEPMSLRKADRLIAVSNACKRDLEAQGVPAAKIEVIEHGVSERFAYGVPDQEAEVCGRTLPRAYLLHVGSSAPYKNLANLIAGYVLARRDGRTSLPLVFAGDVDAHEIRRNVPADLSDDVVVIGFIAYPYMPALYRRASATVSVSLQETFGVALLESMASGVPLIISPLPAHKEVAGEAALYVDPLDPAAIASAIGELSGSRGVREGLIAAGLDRVRRFSWNSAAERTRALYAVAAAQHRS